MIVLKCWVNEFSVRSFATKDLFFLGERSIIRGLITNAGLQKDRPSWWENGMVDIQVVGKKFEAVSYSTDGDSMAMWKVYNFAWVMWRLWRHCCKERMQSSDIALLFVAIGGRVCRSRSNSFNPRYGCSHHFTPHILSITFRQARVTEDPSRALLKSHVPLSIKSSTAPLLAYLARYFALAAEESGDSLPWTSNRIRQQYGIVPDVSDYDFAASSPAINLFPAFSLMRVKG